MMHDIYDSGCMACPLHKKTSYPCLRSSCMVEFDDSCEVLIVGDSPNPSLSGNGLYSQDRTWRPVREWLESVGIPLENVYCTHLVKCPTSPRGKKRAPTERESFVCGTMYLEQEIAALNPKYIVTLGVSPLLYLTGKKQIARYRGEFLPVPIPTERLLSVLDSTEGIEQTEYKLLPTYHPGYVALNPEKEVSVIQDLALLSERLTGHSTIPFDSYSILDTKEKLDQAFDAIDAGIDSGKYDIVCLDVETGGPNDVSQKKSDKGLQPFFNDSLLLTLSLTFEEGTANVIPYQHPQSPFANDDTTLRYIRRRVSRILTRIPSLGHNYTFDLKWSITRGIKVGKKWHDTMLMASCLFNDTSPLSLEFLATKYTPLLAHKAEMAAEYKRAGTKNLTFCDLGVICRYNGADTDSTFRLFRVLKNMLQEQNLWDVYDKLSSDSIQHHLDMEINGCAIHSDRLEQAGIELLAQLDDIAQFFVRDGAAQEVEHRMGLKEGEFNVGSTDHIATLLSTVYGLDLPAILGDNAYTEKKALSTAKAQLEALLLWCQDVMAATAGSDLEKQYSTYKALLRRSPDQIAKAIQTILDYRAAKKLHSSYVGKFPKLVGSDGMIHPTYGIRTAATARDRCKDPSIQQMPAGSVMKRAFVSRWPLGVFLQADYSQMELRVMAMAAGDQGLIDLFNTGQDIHRMIASMALHIPLDQVTKDIRRRMKAIGFGVPYGRGPAAIALQIGTSTEEAQDLIDKFFALFPRVKEWVETMHAEVDRTGQVKTLHGHRRLIKPRLPKSTKHRQAQNTPIQGTASDLAQEGIQGLCTDISGLALSSKLHSFVHDSIEIDIFPGEFTKVYPLVKKNLVDRVEVLHDWIAGVPLVVDVELGDSWGTLCSVDQIEGSRYKIEGKLDNYTALCNKLTMWDDPIRPIIVTEDREYNSTEKANIVTAVMEFPTGA